MTLGMKCPFCGSSNVEKIKEWNMPRRGYHVVHYVCRNCGGRFNHYVGRRREFVLRVGFKKRS
jgi:transposase-like protein